MRAQWYELSDFISLHKTVPGLFPSCPRFVPGACSLETRTSAGSVCFVPGVPGKFPGIVPKEVALAHSAATKKPPLMDAGGRLEGDGRVFGGWPGLH